MGDRMMRLRICFMVGIETWMKIENLRCKNDPLPNILSIFKRFKKRKTIRINKNFRVGFRRCNNFTPASGLHLPLQYEYLCQYFEVKDPLRDPILASIIIIGSNWAVFN